MLFSLPALLSVRYTRWGIRCVASFILAFLIGGGSSNAQPGSTTWRELGRPVVQNFAPGDYNAHGQNWGLAQHPNGMVYVANGTGILEYDGTTWYGISVGRRGATRSVAVDTDGTIYVGGMGTFGRLVPDSTSALVYESLVGDGTSEDTPFNEVWRTVPTSEGIYFSTERIIYRWHPDEELREWHAEGQRFAMGFSWNDRFYFNEIGTGLKYIVDDEIVMAPDGEFYAWEIIFGAVELPDGNMLFVTHQGNLVLYDGETSSILDTPGIRQAGDLRPYHISLLHDGNIALATRNAGVFILSQEGGLLRIIDESQGLRSQQIWYSMVDQEGGLWLALNNGIARVEMSRAISSFGPEDGLIGWVLDVKRHENNLYAATSSGVFRMDESSPEPRFTSIMENSQTGQCMSLISTEAGLLAGCETGIYQINASGIRPLGRTLGRGMIRSRVHENTIYASMQAGPHVLELVGNEWTITRRILDLPGWALSMDEDEEGSLYMATLSRGFYKIEDPMGEPSFTHFDLEEGLPDSWAETTRINGKSIIYTLDGVYRFTDDRIEPFDEINRRIPFSPDSTLHVLREDANGTLWFIVRDYLGYIPITPDGTLAESPQRIPFIQGQGVTHVYTDIQTDAIWLGHSEGVIRFDPNALPAEFVPIIPIVRTAIDASGYSLIPVMPETIRATSFGNNDLRFTYGYPGFAGNHIPDYQVLLDGFDNDWSGWTSATMKEYTNLAPGTYTFQVRARDGWGNVSNSGVLVFRILPPWYRTWWAWILWGVCAGGVIGLTWFGAGKIRHQRLIARNTQLESTVAERTAHLRITNERLQRVLDQNHEFLSIAAHDLKNPLVGILGFSEILMEESEPGSEQQDLLGVIHQSARQMNTTLTQLMDTDALESGRITMHPEITDVSTLANGVLRRNLIQANNKSIRLIPPNNVPVYGLVDQQYFPRVLDNLVSNAIKFSPAGKEVELHIDYDGDDVYVRVRDYGPGMTEDDMKRVFGKLQRLSARPTGGESSSGLGLYIVDTLVRLHNGSITIDSTPGEGTCFEVRVPRAEPDDRI